MSKKKIAQQNYYLSNQVKMLKCNLRDNSIDIKQEWKLIIEFNKQTFDRILNLTPVFVGVEKDCGEIYSYDSTWDKSSSKKPKTLPTFDGSTFEVGLFDDPVMVDLIEKNAADIFTTDVIAAALMCSTKSNYSFDVEIKKFGSKIFIDKRFEEDDEEHNMKAQDNILDYDTVCETSLAYQPVDEETLNGIWPLMKEARKINNAFLHHSLEKNFMKVK